MQTNIVIDANFHARLTDYGLTAIVSDPNTVEPGSTTSPSVGTVRYMSPELLNPGGFEMSDSNPTKESDIYAFGVVTYQVSVTYRISVPEIKYGMQVITREQPFSGAKDGAIIYGVVTGERPKRPSGPNKWLTDDVWNFISRCWSASWDGRPSVDFAVNSLNDAADAVEATRRRTYVANDQAKRTANNVPGMLRVCKSWAWANHYNKQV